MSTAHQHARPALADNRDAALDSELLCASEMGLDLYAGPVSRYLAGDWSTIVQQAGDAAGTPVMVLRADSSGHIDFSQLDALTEPQPKIDVAQVVQDVARWRSEIIRSLGLNEAWDEDVTGEFYTDKPGWEGYGAVMLLAAYDEQPSLVPGSKIRRLLGSSTVPTVEPAQFQDAPAFKAAYGSPARYPTLLRGAEWCLPVRGGPPLFAAPLPNGKQVTMGHVDRLLGELNELNERTFQLSATDLEAARQAGPIEPFRFGLGVLIASAEFAVSHGGTWIMDY